MKQMTPTKIRDQLLREKGLVRHKAEPTKRHRLRAVPHPNIPLANKTPMMQYLELRYGEPIETILVSGSLSVVAKRLGNLVAPSTISKWIKRLKLRYGADNLPDCDTCTTRQLACEGGVCHILIELELYELVKTKQDMVIGQ